MNIKGFEIDVHAQEKTNNWCTCIREDGTYLEVYFSTVKGAYLSKKLPDNYTIKSILDEHKFLSNKPVD